MKGGQPILNRNANTKQSGIRPSNLLQKALLPFNFSCAIANLGPHPQARASFFCHVGKPIEASTTRSNRYIRFDKPALVGQRWPDRRGLRLAISYNDFLVPCIASESWTVTK